jgi:cell division protein FtsL
MLAGQGKYTPGGGYWLILLALLAGIAGTGIGIVNTTFVSRQLLNARQGLEQQRNQLQVEWRRLLLEQSSLVAQGKVEDLARSQLGMEVPDMEKTVVLKSD